MSEGMQEAELQQAAATGAAAAVGAVADDQRIAADAEAARLAAETSAEIAQTAAMASEMAAEVATTAVTDAGNAQATAESAVQQAGSVHDEVTSLRSEFADQLGQLTQSVRSLLTLNQDKDDSSNQQVTSVTVDGDKPEPQRDETGKATESSSGTTGDGDSGGRKRRHKFGRRLF